MLTMTNDLSKREAFNIEKKIEGINVSKLYKKLYKKAMEHPLPGITVEYFDIKAGKTGSTWLPHNIFKDLWGSLNRIMLCSINTPVEKFTAKEILDEYDQEDESYYNQKDIIDVYDWICFKYGIKTLNARIENVVKHYADNFQLDWKSIKNQLDNIYVNAEI